MKKILILTTFLVLLLSVNAFAGNIIYVRTDGGPGGASSTTCNGTANVAFTGSNGPNCAFNHPNWPIPGAGQSTTYKAASGDTIVIASGSYRMGCPGSTSCYDDATNYSNGANCFISWTYDCGNHDVTNGTSGDWTEVVGCTTSGCADPADRPQLYGVGRINTIFNMAGASYIKFQDIEITDHWGADAECVAGAPVQPCARAAFTTGAGSNWHDLTFDGMDIHGLTKQGFGKWGGPGAGGSDANWVVIDSNIDGNKSAGIDMDGCGNNGSCGITGSVDFTNVNMRWNGCSEAYPVVWGADGVNGKIGRLPTVSGCREGNNAGYGDMIGTSDTGGTWTFTNCNFSHNTSDAIDLLYCGRNDRQAYGDCDIHVINSRFEGNNGAAVKGPINEIKNSLIIGNCGYWGQAGVNYDAAGYNPCRATGTPISLSLRDSDPAHLVGNTIFSMADVAILVEDNTSCDVRVHNNVIIGAFDYHGFDRTAMYYSEDCLSFAPTEDYNICDGEFKAGYSHCTNTNDQWDTDVQFTGAVLSYLGSIGDSKSGYYADEDFMELFYLGAASPARDAADETVTGGTATDVNNFARGASWDLGAYEFGTEEQPGGSAPCAATTINNCDLVLTSHGGNDGTCAAGYSVGACNYSCSDGTWSVVSNTCALPATCGDGTIDAGEQCDCGGDACTAAELDNQTCVSRGFSSGALSCNDPGDCQFDESGCVTYACQNGTVDPGEQCDDGNATEGDGCSSLCETENPNYELFLNYTETDPNSKYTVATHTVTMSGVGREESAKLEVDKGAGNIGDFVYDYKIQQTDCVDSTAADITYDAGSEGTSDLGTSVTNSHTVANQSNRIMICGITREEFGTNRSISSVVFNTSETMTSATGVTTADGNNKVDIYYLLNPTATTANVVATFSGQVSAAAMACDTYYNVAQQAPEVLSTSQDGTNVFTATTNNSVAYKGVVASISTATLTTTDNERHNFANTGDLKMAISDKIVSPAGQTTMTYTVSSGNIASALATFAPSNTGGDTPAAMGIFGITSTQRADLKAQETAGDGVFLYLTCKNSVSENIWNLVTVDSGTSTDTYTDANYNITRWGQLERSGTTLTNKVYSDESMSTLLDTQTVTTTATTHRYITVAPTYNDSETGTSFTGAISNIDLTATGGPTPPPANIDSFIINGYQMNGSSAPDG